MVNGEMELALIGKRLLHYENKLKTWKDDLNLEGKNLMVALIELHSHAAYYDETKAELGVLLAYIQMLKEERAGEVNRMFSEDSKFNHTYNGIQQILKSDPEYIKFKRIELEVKELYDIAYAICGQFQQQSYTFTNIVKVMKSDLKDVILTKNHG